MDDTTPEGLVKIHITINNDMLGTSGESVWAKPLGNDLYEIRNTPWHTFDVNWGDVVKAVAEDEQKKPEFIEVVRQSGHRSLHILFFEGCAAEEKRTILGQLRTWKANYENADGMLYAVDVPPEGDFDGLCEYLDGLVSDTRLDYRTIISSAD
jgi:hypothetical protein